MSACTEHFRTVQDIEQARDYPRHASRGVDSGRLFVHAPCTLQSALGGAHHAPAEPPAQVVRLGCEGEGRSVSPQARLRLLQHAQRRPARARYPDFEHVGGECRQVDLVCAAQIARAARTVRNPGIEAATRS